MTTGFVVTIHKLVEIVTYKVLTNLTCCSAQKYNGPILHAIFIRHESESFHAVVVYKEIVGLVE